MSRCYVRRCWPTIDGVSTEVSPERVTPEQLRVWRSFLRAHAVIVRRLETDLMDRHGMPLAWYDVLARLVESDGHRLRMSDLADRVMLSPSGLTRLVDRLVEAGLICREPSESDARGSYAATASGSGAGIETVISSIISPMLRVACCVLRVACCVLRVAC